LERDQVSVLAQRPQVALQLMFWRRKRERAEAARQLILLNLHGAAPMATFQIVNDMVATVPLKAVDQAGRDVPLPTGTTASGSDDAVATVAVSVTTGGDSLVLTPVAPAGAMVVTVTNGGLTATLAVDVVAPVVTALVFDTADATFAAKT
jgi:hypothetical protein